MTTLARALHRAFPSICALGRAAMANGLRLSNAIAIQFGQPAQAAKCLNLEAQAQLPSPSQLSRECQATLPRLLGRGDLGFSTCPHRKHSKVRCSGSRLYPSSPIMCMSHFGHGGRWAMTQLSFDGMLPLP